MKIKKEDVIQGVLIMLLLLTSVLLLGKLEKVEEYADVFSVYIERKMTSDEGEELFQTIGLDENILLVIWGEERNIIINNNDLDRESTVDKISVCGQPDLLFMNIDITYFDDEDTNGCIIDEKAANDLFGGINVKGKTISYDGQEFFVRSVIQGDNGLFIVRGRKKQEQVFHTINFVGVDTNQYEMLKSSLSTTYGIAGDIIDYPFFVDVAHILCWVSVSVLMLFISSFFRLKAGYSKNRQYYLWKALRILMLCVIIFWILRRFSISANFIPTKWSDFSFWSKLYESKKESIISFIKMKKNLYEFYYIKQYWSFLFYNLVANAILLIWLTYRKVLKVHKLRLIEGGTKDSK